MSISLIPTLIPKSLDIECKWELSLPLMICSQLNYYHGLQWTLNGYIHWNVIVQIMCIVIHSNFNHLHSTYIYLFDTFPRLLKSSLNNIVCNYSLIPFLGSLSHSIKSVTIVRWLDLDKTNFKVYKERALNWLSWK